MAWSPDGEEIAFADERPDFKHSLHVIAADGTEERVLLDYGDNYSPGWSPDGTRIAFARSAGGETGLYTIRPDGTGLTKRIDHGSAPVWSPDGEKIVFNSRRANNCIELYVADTLSWKARQLTDSGECSPPSDFFPTGLGPRSVSPVWYPNGKLIVFEAHRGGRRPDIYIASADGAYSERLTWSDASDTYPQLLSGGQTIMFTSDRREDLGSEIFLMGMDGKGARPLTHRPGPDEHAEWTEIRHRE